MKINANDKKKIKCINSKSLKQFQSVTDNRESP